MQQLIKRVRVAHSSDHRCHNLKADSNKKRDSDASKGDAPSKKSKSSGSKDSKQVAVAIDAD